MVSRGITPTVFYWLNQKKSKVLKPNDIKKKNLDKFNTIILVRYIPFILITELFKLKHNSKKIILLLDDNLLDQNIFSELPFMYKLRIFFNIYCYKFLFKFIINEIWVTNKRLGEKVKNKISSKYININLLDLNYKTISYTKKLYRVAYLGTSSHTLELKWLKPLFEKLQYEREDCLIEIYIDKKWRNYFKSIPRLKMIYPMNWETFYLDSSSRKVDIVLNPIIKSKFNNYRSPTKFFDATRFGAVGIYSNHEPFSDFIINNYDGILLENNIDLWISKISYLLGNEEEKKRILSNALKKYK